jgi:hypothetical protein
MDRAAVEQFAPLPAMLAALMAMPPPPVLSAGAGR